mmetsp:Transcript_70508/g.204357  ORF Transcript_70508/g.204357 Transcript_70508/m.204357 type:complete len:208 (+) Transcript_70508:1249-1872(+)
MERSSARPPQEREISRSRCSIREASASDMPLAAALAPLAPPSASSSAARCAAGEFVVRFMAWGKSARSVEAMEPDEPQPPLPPAPSCRPPLLPPPPPGPSAPLWPACSSSKGVGRLRWCCALPSCKRSFNCCIFESRLLGAPASGPGGFRGAGAQPPNIPPLVSPPKPAAMPCAPGPAPVRAPHCEGTEGSKPGKEDWLCSAAPWCM